MKMIIASLMILTSAMSVRADIEQYIWIGFQTQPPPMTASGEPDMSGGYAKWWKKGPTLSNPKQEGTIWVDGADGHIIKNTVTFKAVPVETTN